MKTSFVVSPIGSIAMREGNASVVLNKQFVVGLLGLDGFSHLQIVWWFSGCDDDVSRNTVEVTPPYRKFIGSAGVFATRSPHRPNPIGITTAAILGVDLENGVIRISFTDAEGGTPVLGLKPYTPSLDRVEAPYVPDWCGHWPRSLEESADFDWEEEF